VTARRLRPKTDRTLVFLILCAAAMPLAMGHLGRLPWLLLAVGLTTYGVTQLIRRLPSCYRAQAISVVLVVALYACSALTSVKPDTLGNVNFSDHTGFHAGLAESMLRGKLSLPAEPSKGLLQSKTPYAVPRSFPFVWDASYYAGQYYIYFGVTPVLTLYLPFRIIAQRSLPTPLALVILLAAGFIGSVFVLERARRECGIRRPSEAIQVVSTLLLGLASMSPLILRRPSIYEVSIASAYCFSMWGFYFLLGQIRRTTRWGAPVGALLASLMLGLSAGSRPTFVATGVLLILVFLVQARRHWEREGSAVLNRIVPLIGPFAVCLFLLGLYNKLRFDSWTECGLRYQLNHIELINMQYGADKILRGLAYYLFSSPTYAHQFPPIHVDQTSHPFGLAVHPTVHEGVLGLFTTVPVSLMLAGAPLVARSSKNSCLGWLLLSLVGFAVLMLLAASAAGVTPRYELDFVPPILVATILTFYATQSRQARTVGILTEVLWIPAACYSIVIGLVASISDHATPDSLKTYYPAIHALLERVLWP
jgi:hypothetical protein